MRPAQARFVTASQQLLALGAILAVLAPAANVLTLQVVPAPGSSVVTGAGEGVPAPAVSCVLAVHPLLAGKGGPLLGRGVDQPHC